MNNKFANRFMLAVALFMGFIFLNTIISAVRKHNDGLDDNREKRQFEVQIDDVEKGNTKKRYTFCLEYDKWKREKHDNIKRANEVCDAVEETFFVQHEDEIRSMK